jgi:hypothetical protein
VIHRTYRSLDRPPKLVGFTVAQWAALICGAFALLAIVHLTGMPAKAAITLAVFTLGLPAALAYVSEAGGVRIGGLLWDALRWRLGAKVLAAVSAAQPPAGRSRRLRARADAASLLDLDAIGKDGLLLRDDGTHVRFLQTGAVNAIVMDPAEAERISAAFAQIAARLPDGQSLQLYAHATALDVPGMLGEEQARCERAARDTDQTGCYERSDALRRLGELQRESVAETAERTRPLELRFLVICPWRPAGRGLLAGRAKHPVSRERAVRDSLRHSQAICAELDALGLQTGALDGQEVLELLRERFAPDRPCSPPSGPDNEDAPDAPARTICTAPIALGSPRHLQIGQTLERVIHVALAPERTWLGWLSHLTQAPRPFTLSVHVHATERYRERLAQKRRYKRLFGVNRGVEQRGRPLDPDARTAEQEAAELTAELSSSTAVGIYRMSIYLALREADGDPEALGELAEACGRELSMASDARVSQGPFAQRALWRSTLPLGLDAARRTRKYVSTNVGDSFPLCASGCGSPDGIALGYALPGRTLERLDPFDAAHPNHLLLINGMSGAGKTMAAIVLLSRAISQGAGGFIIDRAGHFEFLVSLLPGACTVQIGGEAHAINSWDVPDPALVSAEKVDYLLALHALLLGEHHAGRDSYGLTDLESNLLGLAIVEVYERCALTGEEPRELLLQEELERRYETERAEGSLGIAEALRNLSMRLSNYLREGPYGYLTDRPTTIGPETPLVVFDTRMIPEAKAAAALFVICEHVKSQIEQTRSQHLAGAGPAHDWAGRRFLAIDEAWKLIERPATGRWFNEFCRRSRHYALWLIAISQQLSDFETEHGKALLSNAAMRLFLRQEARELGYAREALALSDGAIEAISTLQTVRGSHSTAYLMNGSRGQGTLQVAVGAREYWLASSDPARDEPRRRASLRRTGGDPWAALELLADEDRERQVADS